MRRVGMEVGGVQTDRGARPHAPAPVAPTTPRLVIRRHVDFGRVSSALCSRRPS